MTVAFLAGCRGDPASEGGPLVQHRADWAALTASLPPEPAAQARILEEYRLRHGLPLLFRAEPDSAAVAGLPLVTTDHACGLAAPAFVKSIPLDHPTLGTRFVLEVDSAADALLRWEVPLDVSVVGVAGMELLVSPGPRPADVQFRIRPDGSFVVEAGRALVAPAPVWPQGVCPNRPELAALPCEEFRDGGRRRMILHPSPCH
ncbi:hypothetical protein BH23GEM2_BH23GEM2_18260 [soil metagenome]